MAVTFFMKSDMEVQIYTFNFQHLVIPQTIPCLMALALLPVSLSAQNCGWGFFSAFGIVLRLASNSACSWVVMVRFGHALLVQLA
jgi:hypothetical protein